MYKRYISYILVLLCTTFMMTQPSLAAHNQHIDKSLCTFKGFPLHGRVQIVNSFPNIKIQVVNSFADLHVQRVSSFPNSCGKFETVNSFPDVKVQFVSSFPNMTIAYVDAFPGIQ